MASGQVGQWEARAGDAVCGKKGDDGASPLPGPLLGLVQKLLCPSLAATPAGVPAGPRSCAGGGAPGPPPFSPASGDSTFLLLST